VNRSTVSAFLVLGVVAWMAWTGHGVMTDPVQAQTITRHALILDPDNDTTGTVPGRSISFWENVLGHLTRYDFDRDERISIVPERVIYGRYSTGTTANWLQYHKYQQSDTTLGVQAGKRSFGWYATHDGLLTDFSSSMHGDTTLASVCTMYVALTNTPAGLDTSITLTGSLPGFRQWTDTLFVSAGDVVSVWFGSPSAQKTPMLSCYYFQTDTLS
jgi:hypothetical protein